MVVDFRPIVEKKEEKKSVLGKIKDFLGSIPGVEKKEDGVDFRPIKQEDDGVNFRPIKKEEQDVKGPKKEDGVDFRPIEPKKKDEKGILGKIKDYFSTPPKHLTDPEYLKNVHWTIGPGTESLLTGESPRPVKKDDRPMGELFSTVDTPYGEQVVISPDVIKGTKSGVLETILTTPQVFGSLVTDYARQIKKLPTTEEIGAKKYAPTLQDVVKQAGLSKKTAKYGQDLVKKNRRWVSEEFPEIIKEPKTKVEGFFKDLGSGATTLAGALGISVVTGSPHAAAVTFGLYQKGQLYQEAVDKDISHTKASYLSTIGGVAEGSLEYIGLKYFFGKYGSPVRTLISRTMTESLQEGLQTEAENIVTQFGGIRKFRGIESLFDNVGRSMTIGALLGGPGSLSLQASQSSKLVKRLMNDGGLSRKEAENVVDAFVEKSNKRISKMIEDTLEGEVKDTEPGVIAGKIVGLQQKNDLEAYLEMRRSDSVERHLRQKAMKEEQIREETLKETVRDTYIDKILVNNKFPQTPENVLYGALLKVNQLTQNTAEQKGNFVKGKGFVTKLGKVIPQKELSKEQQELVRLDNFIENGDMTGIANDYNVTLLQSEQEADDVKREWVNNMLSNEGYQQVRFYAKEQKRKDDIYVSDSEGVFNRMSLPALTTEERFAAISNARKFMDVFKDKDSKGMNWEKIPKPIKEYLLRAMVANRKQGLEGQDYKKTILDFMLNRTKNLVAYEGGDANQAGNDLPVWVGALRQFIEIKQIPSRLKTVGIDAKNLRILSYNKEQGINIKSLINDQITKEQTTVERTDDLTETYSKIEPDIVDESTVAEATDKAIEDIKQPTEQLAEEKLRDIDSRNRKSDPKYKSSEAQFDNALRDLRKAETVEEINKALNAVLGSTTRNINKQEQNAELEDVVDTEAARLLSGKSDQELLDYLDGLNAKREVELSVDREGNILSEGEMDYALTEAYKRGLIDSKGNKIAKKKLPEGVVQRKKPLSTIKIEDINNFRDALDEAGKLKNVPVVLVTKDRLSKVKMYDVKEGRKHFKPAGVTSARDSIYIHPRTVLEVWDVYRNDLGYKTLKDMTNAEWLATMIPNGLTQREFLHFVIEHERVHLATGLDGSKIDELVTSALALERMGRTDIADVLWEQIPGKTKKITEKRCEKSAAAYWETDTEFDNYIKLAQHNTKEVVKDKINKDKERQNKIDKRQNKEDPNVKINEQSEEPKTVEAATQEWFDKEGLGIDTSTSETISEAYLGLTPEQQARFKDYIKEITIIGKDKFVKGESRDKKKRYKDYLEAIQDKTEKGVKRSKKSKKVEKVVNKGTAENMSEASKNELNARLEEASQEVQMFRETLKSWDDTIYKERVEFGKIKNKVDDYNDRAQRAKETLEDFKQKGAEASRIEALANKVNRNLGQARSKERYLRSIQQRLNNLIDSREKIKQHYLDRFDDLKKSQPDIWRQPFDQAIEKYLEDKGIESLEDAMGGTATSMKKQPSYGEILKETAPRTGKDGKMLQDYSFSLRLWIRGARIFGVEDTVAYNRLGEAIGMERVKKLEQPKRGSQDFQELYQKPIVKALLGQGYKAKMDDMLGGRAKDVIIQSIWETIDQKFPDKSRYKNRNYYEGLNRLILNQVEEMGAVNGQPHDTYFISDIGAGENFNLTEQQAAFAATYVSVLQDIVTESADMTETMKDRALVKAAKMTNTSVKIAAGWMADTETNTNINVWRATNYANENIFIRKLLGMNFKKGDIYNWVKERKPKVFTKMLHSIDPKLVGMSAWMQHQNVELRDLQLDNDILVGSNAVMYTDLGWFHRFATKEKGKPGGYRISGLEKNKIPERKKISFADHAADVRETGMAAWEVGDLFGKYISESLKRVDKKKALDTFKLAKSEITGWNLVMYSHQVDDDPMTAKKKLMKNNYVQMHEASGLAEYFKGVYAKPWVHQSLVETVELIQSSRKWHKNLKYGIRINAAVKRMILATPLYFAPQVASTPATWLGMKQYFFGLSELANVGEMMKWNIATMKGKQKPYAYMQGKGYEADKIMLMLKNGSPGFGMMNIIRSMYDDTANAKHPMQRTRLQNLAQMIIGKGGMDNQAFNHYISKVSYRFTDFFFDKFHKMGIPKDEAARMATSLANDLTGLIGSDIFGPEGAVFQGILFSRSFTYSYLRQLTGAMYPVLGKLPGIKKLYNYHTGGFSRLLNSLFHGEKGKVEMDMLWTYYLGNLTRVTGWKLLWANMIQIALTMAFGDEEEKKHPTTFSNKGKIFRKLQVRTPKHMFNILPWYKDVPARYKKDRYIYVDALALREAMNIFRMIDNPREWGKNKQAWMVRAIITAAKNQDWRGDPVMRPGARGFLDYIEHTGKSMLPSPFRKSPRMGWPGKTGDYLHTMMRLSNFLGIMFSMGPSEYTDPAMLELLSKQQEVSFYKSKMEEEFYLSEDVEKTANKYGLSAEQIGNLLELQGIKDQEKAIRLIDDIHMLREAGFPIKLPEIMKPKTKPKPEIDFRPIK